MKLTLETNTQPIHDPTRPFEEVGILVAPPVNEDFWLFRVVVSPTQAIVGFPKFGMIGIGFQQETDWNCNLPSTCSTAEIYSHIRCNKGDPKIRRERCVRAIRLIQEAAHNLKLHEPKTNRTLTTS